MRSPSSTHSILEAILLPLPAASPAESSEEAGAVLRCCPQSCGIAGFPETENQGCGKAGGAMVGRKSRRALAGCRTFAFSVYGDAYSALTRSQSALANKAREEKINPGAPDNER